ncbi:MAG: hypothetical protein V3V23_02250 [Dehalococcoidales bacterium]
MNKTWKPIVAGILALAAGGMKLLTLLGLLVASFVIPVSTSNTVGINISILLLVATIFLAILGILAIIGGIYALQRKRVSLALTGSIAALIPFSLLGLASIILIVLSKDEFE